MGKYFDMLMEDVRMKEGLTACMNCGICTGVCPRPRFHNYDPRQIVNMVQTKDDDAIEKLLKSDTIWYCRECISQTARAARARQYARIYHPVAAHAVAKTRFLHRVRERTPATGHQTHHRAEYPDVGLLRRSRISSIRIYIPNRGRYGGGSTTTTKTSSNVSATTTAR